MRKLIYFFLFSLLLTGWFQVYSQSSLSGRYDLRFVVNSINCTTNKMLIDVEVKAADDDSTFYMGDQNYKFTYNRSAISLNPTTVTELGFSGSLRMDPNNPNSLFQPYNPHSVLKIDPGTGSVALGILNVVWQPGRNGVLVEDTGWSPVSRLEFDIVDATQTQCLNLNWRDQSNATHFTNITEVEPTPPPGSASTQPFTTTTTVIESLYGSLGSCLDVLCNPTFPVEWAGFSVNYNGYFAEINWSTALELNNDYFVVERSANGQDFAALSQVSAKGSNSSYYYEDRTVSSAGSDRLYYRIRQYDVNGENSTSDVVEILVNEKPRGINLIGVYPNPADDYVTLQLEAMNLDSVSFTITDASGKVVRNIKRTNAQDEMTIDTKGLANGFYVIRVYDGNTNALGKFHIVR